jgi:hypothetical protein
MCAQSGDLSILRPKFYRFTRTQGGVQVTHILMFIIFVYWCDSLLLVRYCTEDLLFFPQLFSLRVPVEFGQKATYKLATIVKTTFSDSHIDAAKPDYLRLYIPSQFGSGRLTCKKYF